ncbi:MAG: hypothetical protein U0326_33260 [Polyangiales bacterium]
MGTRENASASRVSHFAEALAAALLRAQSTTPAAVMADAGLTPTVIDALNTAAENAMSAHAVHVEARTTGSPPRAERTCSSATHPRDPRARRVVAHHTSR